MGHLQTTKWTLAEKLAEKHVFFLRKQHPLLYKVFNILKVSINIYVFYLELELIIYIYTHTQHTYTHTHWVAFISTSTCRMVYIIYNVFSTLY